MIVRTVKLRLSAHQEKTLAVWLWNLTGVYNWAVRKVELDARDGVFHSEFDFQSMLAGHSRKLGIPSHVLRGTVSQAYTAWQRCFQKLSKKPRLKGQRNKLNSIAFPDPINAPIGNKIKLPGVGNVRFHKQDLPVARIKCGVVLKTGAGLRPQGDQKWTQLTGIPEFTLGASTSSSGRFVALANQSEL